MGGGGCLIAEIGVSMGKKLEGGGGCLIAEIGVSMGKKRVMIQCTLSLEI